MSPRSLRVRPSTRGPADALPDGYARVRVDSRGAGRSPGVVDHHSPREYKDFHDCIEWVGTRDWCNGKVGLSAARQ
jgi:predicted acyl esterase